MSTHQPKPSPIPAMGLFIWGLASLFFIYEFFLRTFLGSFAHQIIESLSLNAETFALLGSGYYIAYGMMQIPVGILTDKFGVKMIMLFAALTCSLSTYVFAISDNFLLAFISRLFMGLGSAFAFICLLVIAITWFPRKYFGFFAGIAQFLGTMGPLLAGGPLVAVMTAYHETWREALTLISYAGFVLSILILLFVKEKPRTTEKKLIFLEKPIALYQKLRKLATNRQAWYIALYSAASYVPIGLLGAIWGTEFLQARGFSHIAAANIISLCWLGYAVGCPIMGALSDIAKRRKPVLIFCAILGACCTSLITYSLSLNQWLTAIIFFLLGLAASGQSVGFATIAEQVDSSTRATALGMNNGSITLFAAIIPPIASFFISQSASSHTHWLPQDFTIGFSLMPLLYVAAIIISIWCIQETFCKPQKDLLRISFNMKTTSH